MDNKINSLIAEWLDISTENSESWHERTMYLDDFYHGQDLKCEVWLERSIKIYDNILSQKFLFNPLLLMLRIPLKNDINREFPNKIDMNFILDSINELIPPCFFFSTKEYFQTTYLNTLSEVDKTIMLSENDSTLGETRIYSESVYEPLDYTYYKYIFIVA